ncbi:hypothetical protein BDZ88DRAFT_221062 [Geranomyces variabilis]|nr:hypothetical protein BDZ88DRAFT_221062 [Geranomyces variabilis]
MRFALFRFSYAGGPCSSCFVTGTELSTIGLMSAATFRPHSATGGADRFLPASSQNRFEPPTCQPDPARRLQWEYMGLAGCVRQFCTQRQRINIRCVGEGHCSRRTSTEPSAHVTELLSFDVQQGIDGASRGAKDGSAEGRILLVRCSERASGNECCFFLSGRSCSRSLWRTAL